MNYFSCAKHMDSIILNDRIEPGRTFIDNNNQSTNSQHASTRRAYSKYYSFNVIKMTIH